MASEENKLNNGNTEILHSHQSSCRKFPSLKCVFGLVTRKQVGCFVEVLNPQPLLAAFLLMLCLKSLFELRAAKLFR